ncbi:GLIPR1-like protein 1 [Mytilus galloprovincialis]|uniref:GLIPR1-like protein 1 n=1 Tax=Mytilus galloprovincialis TaxID=29158 RepID=UPI003F7C245E
MVVLSFLVVLLPLFGTCLGSIYSSLLLNEHNRYRKSENAANMQKLVWSPTLEQEATAWASRCSNSHQQNGRGENLAMQSVGEDINVLIKRGIKMWFDEKRDYSPGRGFSMSTGHYTQMVWADSKQLGCGVQICNANSKFPMKYMYLVCFYDPPGNFNNREPYINGQACSRCRSGQKCDAGLCSDHSTGGRNVPSTPTKVNSRSNVNGGTDWKYSPWKIVNENQRTKPDQNRRITTTRENKPNGRVVWSWTSGNNRRGQQTNNQNSQPRTSRNWNLPQSWNRNTGRNMNIRRRVWTSGQNTGTPITNWSYSWSS